MSQVNQSDVRSGSSLGLTSRYGLALSSPFLIDNLLPENVSGAWSLRRLTASASPICLRGRRTSDNALADIMFDANNRVSLGSPVIPVAGGSQLTLAAWANGSSVTVVNHNDQAGRNPPATAVPVAAQPLLLDSGVLITNEGSPPLIAYDGANDYNEWRYVRTHPNTVILAGSMPNSASAGAPFAIDGQVAAAPQYSGAAIIPGNPGRSIYSDISLGDSIDDRNHYRIYVAVFNSTQSAFYAGGALVASGDSGAEPVVNLLVGKNAAGVFSNTSYHTIITLSRALSAAEASVVSATIGAWA